MTNCNFEIESLFLMLIVDVKCKRCSSSSLQRGLVNNSFFIEHLEIESKNTEIFYAGYSFY